MVVVSAQDATSDTCTRCGNPVPVSQDCRCTAPGFEAAVEAAARAIFEADNPGESILTWAESQFHGLYRTEARAALTAAVPLLPTLTTEDQALLARKLAEQAEGIAAAIEADPLADSHWIGSRDCAAHAAYLARHYGGQP